MTGRRRRRRRRSKGQEDEDGLGAPPPPPIYSRRKANRRPLTARAMLAILHAIGSRQVWRLPRRRGEVEKPTSHQAPRIDLVLRQLGPTVLRPCPLALPRSQVRARLGPGGYWRHSGNGSPDLPACGPRRGAARRHVRPIFTKPSPSMPGARGLLSVFWEPGYPNFPTCSPRLGLIDDLVGPIYDTNKSRTS